MTSSTSDYFPEAPPPNSINISNWAGFSAEHSGEIINYSKLYHNLPLILRTAQEACCTYKATGPQRTCNWTHFGTSRKITPPHQSHPSPPAPPTTSSFCFLIFAVPFSAPFRKCRKRAHCLGWCLQPLICIFQPQPTEHTLLRSALEPSRCRWPFLNKMIKTELIWLATLILAKFLTLVRIKMSKWKESSLLQGDQNQLHTV